MQTKICKVIAQTEPVYVQSKKSENGIESNGTWYQDIVANEIVTIN